MYDFRHIADAPICYDQRERLREALREPPEDTRCDQVKAAEAHAKNVAAGKPELSEVEDLRRQLAGAQKACASKTQLLANAKEEIERSHKENYASNAKAQAASKAATDLAQLLSRATNRALIDTLHNFSKNSSEGG